MTMPRPIERRTVLKLAAAGAVWSVPLVVAVQPAAAAGSRPPRTPLPPATSPPQTPPTTVPKMGPPLPAELQGTLPFTGPQELERNTEVAAVALATGVSLVLLGEGGRRALTDE